VTEDSELPFTGGELTLALRVAGGARKLLRRPPPVAVLKYREKVREEIREKLQRPDSGGSPDTLLVRLSKKDHYPSTDSLIFGLFRASPWFKFEAKGLHDRGFEVFAGIEYVTFHNRKARRVSTSKPEPPDCRKVWVVGRVPYERIAYIDWRPDPYYSAPRLYVRYGWRGPFREVVLYEESALSSTVGREGRRSDEGLYEILDVEYQGEAGNPWRWTAYTARRLRFALEDRRQRRRCLQQFPP
jgi:hypothetical protein